MALQVAKTIQTVSGILGILADTDWLAGKVTSGGDSVEIVNLPTSVDTYVGDAFKVDFECRFHWEEHTWYEEEIRFDFQILYDGVRVLRKYWPENQSISAPSCYPPSTKTESRDFQGELWFMASRFNCDDPADNLHMITAIGIIHNHWLRDFDPNANYVTVVPAGVSRKDYPDYSRYMDFGEHWFLTDHPWRQAWAVDRVDVPLRVHNPYFVDQEEVIDRRDHHKGTDVMLRYRTRVDYRLSGSSVLSKRPDKAKVRVWPLPSKPGWRLATESDVEFEFMPPQDERVVGFSSTHDDPHHPNEEVVYTGSTDLTAHGENSIYEGSDQKRYTWSTHFLRGPNTAQCFPRLFVARCHDAHEDLLGFLDGIEWRSNGAVAVAVAFDQESLVVGKAGLGPETVVLDKNASEGVKIDLGDVHLVATAEVELLISARVPLDWIQGRLSVTPHVEPTIEMLEEYGVVAKVRTLAPVYRVAWKLGKPADYRLLLRIGKNSIDFTFQVSEACSQDGEKPRQQP